MLVPHALRPLQGHLMPRSSREQRELGCQSPSSPTAATGTCAVRTERQTASHWPPATSAGGAAAPGVGGALGTAAPSAALRALAPGTSSRASPGPSASRRQTADERAAVTTPPAAAVLAARCRPRSRVCTGWGGGNLAAEAGNLAERLSNADGRGHGRAHGARCHPHGGGAHSTLREEAGPLPPASPEVQSSAVSQSRARGGRRAGQAPSSGPRSGLRRGGRARGASATRTPPAVWMGPSAPAARAGPTGEAAGMVCLLGEGTLRCWEE